MAQKSDPQGLHRSVFEMDNIHVLRNMDSESVELIYLDPPFNSNATYSAPIGSEAAGAAFKDAWTLSDVDWKDHNRLRTENPPLYALGHSARVLHSNGMFSYLLMMAPRLIEMQRILKPTGNIFLHCDPTAGHYLKTMMDGIFGAANFRNEIVWRRATAHNDPARFGNNTDRILFYRNGQGATWNGDLIPKTPEELAASYPSQDERGRYRSDNITGAGASGVEGIAPWKGYDVGARGQHWSAPLTGFYARWIERNVIPGYRSIEGIHARLDALDKAGLIHHPKKGTAGWPGLKRYAEADKGTPAQALIIDIPGFTNYNKGKEWTGYPTQKPLALLERLIRAASNEGDLVLDPFCGCATTMVAAELLGRKWCGIDLSPLASQLVVQRIKEKRSLFRFKDISHRQTIPVRTDIERRIIKRGKEWEAHKAKMFNDQGGRCNLCHHVFPELRHFQVDHIFPQNKGGKDWEDNLHLLCQSCNSIKGTGTLEEARARLVAKRGIDFSVFEEPNPYAAPPPVLPRDAETRAPYGGKSTRRD